MHEQRPDRFARVPWLAVGVFVAVAYLLAWLAVIPLWFMDDGQPAYEILFLVLVSAMMFTPGLAVLVVVFAMRTPKTQRMRLLGFWPLRPAKRVVWFMVGSLFVPVVLVAFSFAIAMAFGWYQADFQHFSGFEQALKTQLSDTDPETQGAVADILPSTGVLVAVQLALIPVLGLLNLLPVLGEEIGWRGWLLPALRPLGVWPALLISGAIWGVWHAPIILIGYNFNRTDAWGVVFMMVGCMAWGIFFGWLRLRSGSVWPAVIAHGVFNQAATTMLGVFAVADFEPTMVLINPLGVPGWILMAVVALVLVLTQQLQKEPQLASKRRRAMTPVEDASGPES